MAHLFSQPLTVIMGYVDLLAAAAREPGTQKKLKIIKEQLEVLTAYLQNLRELAEYRTVDFGEVTLLDIASRKEKDHS